MHDKSGAPAQRGEYVCKGGALDRRRRLRPREGESRREEPGSKHGLLVSDSELRDRVTRAGSYRGRRGVIRGLESQGLLPATSG